MVARLSYRTRAEGVVVVGLFIVRESFAPGVGYEDGGMTEQGVFSLV